MLPVGQLTDEMKWAQIQENGCPSHFHSRKIEHEQQYGLLNLI
jgi:hypothetical protein